MGQVRIGISGWNYAGWRGSFYPKGLPQRLELEHAASRMSTIEVNGSFYSLQRPESYRSWAERTPPGFVFSVKGGRFITHMRKLAGVETALANFYASGVLALGSKLGPTLWQLPPQLGFDPARLARFFDLLPRTTAAAAELAARHDEKLEGRAWTTTDADRPVRHALEVRHPSYECREFVDLLRENDIALVTADTAGRWPLLEDQTAQFSYVRLHGGEELYVSGYDDEALDSWAVRVRAWAAGTTPPGARLLAPPDPPAPSGGREVFVYFDNDVKARAPVDAIALAARLA
ncbi:uncharacterized protein YecE (DUF72 family) [Kineococcus xinjiangensis]|uniref:Uncharacterized protein YecE (DUF72 family) n=1 Tax=Kineococcus xinjiangensis TaxID=512762 RepID=A0A2S6IEJ0_9ACTN|nr:DUF72 domain-containing protein [Kineococcus xinjiangensis]PPK92632.1 uncharacterized protein YecE (DUF72 family) [Kineococcus xinjiangensis]